MRKLSLVLVLLAAACPGPAPVDVLLEPPPTGEGFQMGTGAFDVGPGQEIQRCYFVTVPGTGSDPIYVSRIVLAQNEGSHHLNVFRVKTVVGLDGKDGDVVDGGECWKSANWADWPLVANSQDSIPGKNTVDWTLPEGVAHKFMPGEKLMLQSHYVNASTQVTPGRARAFVNFWKWKGSGTPVELGTVFATNQNIRVCPGDAGKRFETTCRFAKSRPVTITAANGHFHSRGAQFQMSAVDGANNPVGDTFYTSTTWDDPPFLRGLNVAVPSLGGVGWSCAFNYERPAKACADSKGNCLPYDGVCPDAASTCCISFGGKVEVQEHCNAFVYYYPKDENASCF